MTESKWVKENEQDKLRAVIIHVFKYAWKHIYKCVGR